MMQEDRDREHTVTSEDSIGSLEEYKVNKN